MAVPVSPSGSMGRELVRLKERSSSSQDVNSVFMAQVYSFTIETCIPALTYHLLLLSRGFLGTAAIFTSTEIVLRRPF
jgi:hypothetical protein